MARQQLSAAADTGKVWPEGYFDLYASIDDPAFSAPEELPGSVPRTAGEVSFSTTLTEGGYQFFRAT